MNSLTRTFHKSELEYPATNSIRIFQRKFYIFCYKVKLNDLYFGHNKFPSFSMSIFVICFGATGGDSSEETTIEGVILDFLFISGAIFNFSFVTGYLYFFRPSYSFINYPKIWQQKKPNWYLFCSWLEHKIVLSWGSNFHSGRSNKFALFLFTSS